MLDFIHAILSRDEAVVDSILVTAALATLALIFFTGWALYLDKTTWSPVGFGTAACGIIGAMGGAKRLRDGPCNGGTDAH